MRKAVALSCLFIATLSIPVSALAQAVYGNVVGTVVDPSGRRRPEREGDHQRHEQGAHFHHDDQ